jgi:glycerol kinase
MAYLLALDQGTTSSRAIVFNERCQMLAVAQQELTQHYPQPGWVEHDADEIWRSQLDCARRAVEQAGLTGADIAAIGIANQRETTVLWDRKTGQPIAPAIVWQDRRTAPDCERLSEHAALFTERTGLVLDAYFSGTKLAWLLDHVPGARARAEAAELAFGTIDSWLTWKLSNGAVHATDVSNASRTLMFNLHTLQWDPQLLELLHIPPAVLPQVVSSSGMVAHCANEHLGAAIPIAGLAGDQQAATFGQACFAPGMAKNTYGTGCFMLMNTGAVPAVSTNRLLTTVGWRLGNDTRAMYCLEGSVFVGGAVVQWLRDGLGLIGSADEIEALAMSVPDSGDVMLVPAFTGLGAPHWDPHARGTVVGLTRGSHRGHIARAALESIAFQSAELLQAMQADAPQPLTELRVDGGASRNNLMMQFQADLLGVPILRPQVTETTALGAVLLAGLAVGVWQDTAQVAQHWRCERIFEPAMSADERAARMARWRQALDRSRAWAAA